MIDWILDRSGLLLLLGLVALLFGGIALAVNHDEHQATVACARMWAASRTSADTIAVIRDCELPKHSETTVVAVPVVVGR